MRTTIPDRRLALLLVLVLAGRGAPADELIMQDGSRLFGKVVTKERKTLVFRTGFAGDITVEWGQVSELRTDELATVLLASDEVIKARVVKNDEEDAFIEQEPGAPVQTLKQADMAYINPESWRLGEGSKFTGRIDLSFESERGNTDKDEIDFDSELLWRRKQDRMTFWGELENDKTDGKRTTDTWEYFTKYDYFFRKRSYYGVGLGMEHDQFADLNLRTKLGPHVGHRFFESKAMTLEVDAGAGPVWENFKTQPNNRYPAAAWLVRFDRSVFRELIQFYHNHTGLWNLENTSDLVLKTRTGLRFPLSWGFVASTELQADFDSGAAENADELDTTYRLKLGYQW